MRAPVPVSVRGVPIDAAQAREHLLGELAAVARVHRRADHADDDVFPVELLHRDMGRIAQRDVDRLLDQLLDLARARVGREAGPELDSLRLTQRRHRRLDQHPVRDEDAIGPADQRRIEEAELPDDPLEAPGENAGLKADLLANAEGPIGDQHQPGEQVAKHLLGGETDDNGGEAAAHRQGARLQPRDAQRDDGHRQDRHEPEQEADRSRRARLQSPVERRSKGAGEHARQPPAEEHEHDHPWRSSPRGRSREERLALGEAEEDAPDQGEEQQRFALGAPRGGGVDLGAEPDLAPYLGPRLEGRSGSGQQLSDHSLPLSASGRIENVRGVTH